MSTTATNYLSRIYDLKDFPEPGKDNNSQGFRDQWDSIYKAIDAVNDQVEDLDLHTVKSNTRTNFDYNTIEKANFLSCSTEFVDLGIVTGNRDIDYRTGSYQKFELSSGVHNVTITDLPSSGKSGSIRLSITASDNVPTHVRFPFNYVKLTPEQDDAYTLVYSGDPESPVANIFDLWNEEDVIYVQRVSDPFLSYNATLTTATIYLAGNVITTGTGFITQVGSPGGKLSTVALVPNKVITTLNTVTGRNIGVASAKGIVAGARINFSNTWTTYYVSAVVTSTNIVTIDENLNTVVSTALLGGSSITFVNPINSATVQPTVLALVATSANASSTGTYVNGKGSIYAAANSLEVTFNDFGGGSAQATPTVNTFVAKTLADSTATTVNDKTLADTTFVHSILPYGSIIMWYGLKNNVPTGWKICDGSNGTPNLTNKFIIGGSTDVGVVGADKPGSNVMGGASTSTGGAADSVVISHYHTATFAGSVMGTHSHTATDSGHSHLVGSQDSAVNPGSGAGQQEFLANADYAGANVGPAATTSDGNADITVNTASAGTPAGTVTVVSAGEAGTNKNIPPFVALYYIMKVTGTNYSGI